MPRSKCKSHKKKHHKNVDTKLEGTNSSETVVGTTGNDYIKGLDGNDILIGREGNDKISGGDGDDYICGDSGNDKLKGGDGNDTISGGTGKDKIYGGKGDDHIYGGQGADKIYGGKGEDTVTYWGSNAGICVNLEKGRGYGGDAHGDKLKSIENIGATNFNDFIIGSKKDNIIYAGDGDDCIYGKGGDDIISAGSGNDYVNGGQGADTLYGGLGEDLFVFKGARDSNGYKTDIIKDFTSGEDHIMIYDWCIDSFSDLNISFDGHNTVIEADHSYFKLELAGEHLLTSDDFIIA